ncbi:MAG: hypothetical protein LC099_01095 [Anaerolineales bacterium]|nr:hypothetical protein [Anaerolineales bacterium]
MKKIWILLAALIASCAPKPDSQIVLPQLPPTATAYIDSSYPTAEAQIESAPQTAMGVAVQMKRAWVEGKNVNAEVCYTLPDAADWSIWAASLTYEGAALQEFGATLVSLQEPVNGAPGQRCDTLTFIVPPDADLSNAAITIESIAAPPQPSDYCDLYLPKIQQAMQERGTGILINCAEADGALTMQIVAKPEGMSQEQAEAIVYSDEFYALRGPWSFPLSITQ